MDYPFRIFSRDQSPKFPTTYWALEEDHFESYTKKELDKELSMAADTLYTLLQYFSTWTPASIDSVQVKLENDA